METASATNVVANHGRQAKESKRLILTAKTCRDFSCRKATFGVASKKRQTFDPPGSSPSP